MKKLVTDNLLLRVLSLIVGIIIWGVVVNVSDPIIESTYSGVQVEIINSESASFQNKTYQVLDGSDTITVTISAKRSINDLLTKENIRAIADLADLNADKGTIRIHLETNKYNDKIESIRAKSNDSVYLEIEDMMKKQFSITAAVSGEPEEGYVAGDVILDQNVVSVQGPESLVSSIDKAVVEASIAGMSNSISTTSPIKFYDADGNVIDSSRFICNVTSISLKVDILSQKEVGFKFNTTGTPQEGYVISGDITSDVETIMIAGKNPIIGAISTINLPGNTIDIEGKNETFTTTIDVTKYLPENAILSDAEFEEKYEGKITVTVPIEKLESRVVEVLGENITLADYDETKYSLSIVESSVNIGISGLASTVNNVGSGDIKGIISVKEYMNEKGLSELKDGIIAFPAQLEMPEGVTLTDSVVLIQCRVKVNE